MRGFSGGLILEKGGVVAFEGLCDNVRASTQKKNWVYFPRVTEDLLPLFRFLI